MRAGVPATVASLKNAPRLPEATARAAAVRGSSGPAPALSTFPSGSESCTYPLGPPSFGFGRTSCTARETPRAAGACATLEPFGTVTVLRSIVTTSP